MLHAIASLHALGAFVMRSLDKNSRARANYSRALLEGSDTKWNLVHFAWNLKWNLESYHGIRNLVLRINPNKSY